MFPVITVKKRKEKQTNYPAESIACVMKSCALESVEDQYHHFEVELRAS